MQTSLLPVSLLAFSTDLAAIRTDITAIRADITRLNNALAVAVRSPITFAFGGTPVEGSMINIPIVGRTAGVLTIPGTVTSPSSTTLGASRWYSATNPLVQSVFHLTRITATGSTTTIGTITKPAGTGAAVFSGSGAVNVTHGDTLRMTATTVGGQLTNVAITIDATKLY